MENIFTVIEQAQSICVIMRISASVLFLLIHTKGTYIILTNIPLYAGEYEYKN